MRKMICRKMTALVLATIIAMILVLISEPVISKAANTVKITFDANGGTFSNGLGLAGTTLVLEKNVGDTLLSGQTQTLEERNEGTSVNYWVSKGENGQYLANGWSTDGSEENKVEKVPDKDTTVYVIWEETTIIRIDHLVGLDEGVQVVKGKKLGLNQWLMERMEPYVWATDANGENIIDDIHEYIPAGQETLYEIARKGEKTYGNLRYIISDNEVTIIGTKGSEEIIEIPERINELPVTGIDSNAFYWCEMKKVILPASIASIATAAFLSCKNLEEVTIPKNLTYLGNYAFGFCDSLKTLFIPAGLKTIGQGAFQSCYGLTSIVIPESVTSIGDYAFSGCSSLTSIEIPESVTSIGAHAFDYCDDLTIYGYSGSAAEKYANDNNLSFEQIKGNTETENTIILDANGGVFTEVENEEGKIRAIGEQKSKASISLEKLSKDFLFPGWNKDENKNMFFFPALDLPAITNPKKYFLGWSTDKTREHIISELPSAGTTLYAIWADACVITYMGKGFVEKGLNIVQAHRNDTDVWIEITYPAGIPVQMVQPYVITTGDNHETIEVEVNWATDIEGTNIIGDLAEYIPTKDITLYAITKTKDIQTGDVNGDGDVNAKDLTALAKHVAKISTITDADLLAAADVNKDGDVNAKDLTHLAKYVAKIIKEL